MVNLIPMKLAPQDGTEILAWYVSVWDNDAGFHPVSYDEDTGNYNMRWNSNYCQEASDYLGWIKMPKLHAGKAQCGRTE